MRAGKKDHSRAPTPRSSVQLMSSQIRSDDTDSRRASKPAGRAYADEESGRTTSLSEPETSSAARDQDAARRGEYESLPTEACIHGAMLQFAEDVYQELCAASVAKGGTANVVFSPLALQTTLALMLALAKGRTAEQISRVLHLHCCAQQEFQAYMRRRVCKLIGLAGNLGYFCLNNKTRLITGGSTAAPDSADGALLNEALESLRVEHQSADFAHDAEGVRHNTNEWLHVMTAFECERAIPEGAVDARTSLLMASVTSLRAADWKWKFRLRDTVTGVFYNASGAAKHGDKQRGFVVMPPGMFNGKAKNTVTKSMTVLKAKANKVKASAISLCNDLKLDRLAKPTVDSGKQSLAVSACPVCILMTCVVCVFCAV